MLEHDRLVPANLRARLEVARLQNLAVMRTLDRGLPIGTPLPRANVLALGELDADCGEALWALDQPQRSLNVRSMVRDTLTSLERLPAVHQRLRDAVLEYPHALELEILDSLDPAEAYSQVPGRDSTTRPLRRTEPTLAGRNDPCPCRSGRKYKKCCLLSSGAAASSAETKAQPALSRPLYHYKPGSYGGKGSFVPSIACEREASKNERVLYFVLVSPQAVYAEEHDASAAATADLTTAFTRDRSEPAIPEQVALHLRKAGYLVLED